MIQDGEVLTLLIATLRAVLTVDFDPGLPCGFESADASPPDRGSSPFMLIVWCHVADPRVQPNPVVLSSDAVKLRFKNDRVADVEQMRPLDLHVAEEALDVRLVGRSSRPAVILPDGEQRHVLARRSEIICGPLSDHASITGR